MTSSMGVERSSWSSLAARETAAAATARTTSVLPAPAGPVRRARPCVVNARQLHGKELSFNNILDADAALSTVLEFSDIATVAIKHNNHCGVALSTKSLADSFRKAKACDPISIFGGVIAFNRPVDEETATELKEIFLEIVIAPSFTPEAKAVLEAYQISAVKTLIDAGVRLKGDVILTYVVGELQGGVGTLAAIRQGVKADYFINGEPTDLAALTMHAAAFTFVIELTGVTRHLSKREEAVDAIAAASGLPGRRPGKGPAGAATATSHFGSGPPDRARRVVPSGAAGTCTPGETCAQSRPPTRLPASPGRHRR